MSGRVRQAREVGGRARQADADEADVAVLELAGGLDRHHLVGRVVRLRHAAGSARLLEEPVEVACLEDVLAHPRDERLAVAGDRVPGLVEGVVALVVAVRVGGGRAAAERATPR